jgi:RecA/RadA recombinase
MPRTRKNQNLDDSPNNKLKVLQSFLAENKDHHYAYESGIDYIASSGSLTLDMQMAGGIHPGIVRSSGVTEGGKTSNALCFARSFQKVNPDKGTVVYIKSEGRLSESMIERSGVDTTPERWAVIPTNDYEFVIDMMRRLIKDNNENNIYFFILDSLDALVPRNDLQKSSIEANKTAGAALLTSDMLRKMAASFSSKGHICFLISQVRSTIKINQYEKSDPKVTNASGGNAALHYSDWIMEFQQRYKSDIIYANSKKDQPIGHWCKLIFKKTPNEKTGVEVKYPIKYGRTGGSSVWVEYEIVDQLLAWEFAHAKGAWITICDELVKELEEKGLEMPKQHQGQENLKTFLENNQKITKHLYDKFVSVYR